MATERLSMRQIREILRQKWVLACSRRQVAASRTVSIGTVTGVLRRATDLAPRNRSRSIGPPLPLFD